MPAHPNSSPAAQAKQQGPLAALLHKALLLDLEVSERGKILKIGCEFGSRTFARAGSFDLADALDSMSALADSAICLLGHNLVRHDLPLLRETAPRHPLLRLPVIDTLVLSPIAFPENPYHRLVKDYKLVRESVNDPVADARQAAALFADEFDSLAGMRQTEPRLFELLHYLLAEPGEDEERLAKGMELVFFTLGGKRPPAARALDLCRDWFGDRACRNAPVDEALLQTRAGRMAAAYAATWLRVAGSNSVLPPWVRLEHPLAGKLIVRAREVPCASDECAYCRRVHDAREQLRAFFGFDDFRAHPPNAAGGSLQRDISEAG